MRRPDGVVALTGAMFLLGAAWLAASGVTGTTYAAFGGETANGGNQVSAAPDFSAPVVTVAAIGKASGGATGAIRPGGAFYAYANVADGGNPPSGVSTVTADLSALSGLAFSTPLIAGSYSAGGTAYGFRSALLTADSPRADGVLAYSLLTADLAANSRRQAGFTVMVDGTPPSASDVQTANGGATVGRPELGDTVTYLFSEAVEPQSILAGWDGTATGVVVRIDNDAGAGNDLLAVYTPDNLTPLAFSSMNLGQKGYVNSSRTFGLPGTKSTMTMSGAAVTVRLGTSSGGPQGQPVKSGAAMTWSPAAGPTDLAGNPISLTPRTQTGALSPGF